MLSVSGASVNGVASLAGIATLSSASITAQGGAIDIATSLTFDSQPESTPAADRRQQAGSGEFSFPTARSIAFQTDSITLLGAATTGPVFATYSAVLTGAASLQLLSDDLTDIASWSASYTLFRQPDPLGNVINVDTVGLQRTLFYDSQTGEQIIDERGVRFDRFGQEFANPTFAGTYTAQLELDPSGRNDFVLFLDCQVQASVSFTAAGSGACDGIGVRWGGITELRDSNGTLLTGWRLLSDSGFDWARAWNDQAAVVPEPSSWALLIFGFGAIGAAARRRRAVAT